MDYDKIQQKLDKMFENKKSRNFINHLVRAYLPVGKVTKVMEKPEANNFKCALTGAKLISIGEALEGMESEQFKKDFFQHIKSAFNEDNRQESPMKKMLNGRVLGFTGNKTDTYMCQEAFQAFYDWVVTKMLKGDKHINWLLSSMRREELLNRAEVLADDDDSKKVVERMKKRTKKHRGATTKLGDLDALQKLKAKMEGNENKG